MDSLIYGIGNAKCAIDIVLYNIMGKVRGLPLYRLLGGTNPVVHNDITIGIDTPEHMAETAKRNVFEDVFTILKINTGVSLDDDLRALQLIREAVGKDVRIRIDANQGYTAQTALPGQSGKSPSPDRPLPRLPAAPRHLLNLIPMLLLVLITVFVIMSFTPGDSATANLPMNTPRAIKDAYNESVGYRDGHD